MRRAHFPPERNQVPAHLTLFHHLPPDLAPELDRRLAAHAAGPPPRATILGVMDMGRGTAFRIDSEDLADIRYDLAEAFRGLLIPQDQAGFRPHVTVQNKVEPREAKALLAELSSDFRPWSFAADGLQLWRYLDGPWELVSETRFSR